MHCFRLLRNGSAAVGPAFRALGLTALLSVMSTFAHAADDAIAARRTTASRQPAATLGSIETQLAASPKDPGLRFLKGVLLTDAQRRPEAIAVFERLTEDFPDLAEPYNNLAVLYAADGEYERARMALSAALRANPRYAVAASNLADVHLQLALLAYQRAIDLEPRDSAAAAALSSRVGALRRLEQGAAPSTLP